MLFLALFHIFLLYAPQKRTLFSQAMHLFLVQLSTPVFFINHFVIISSYIYSMVKLEIAERDYKENDSFWGYKLISVEAHYVSVKNIN